MPRNETMPPGRPPCSTYRLQFNKAFTFADAAAIVPYLHALGITHCYASSFLKAMPGSTHGYDVIDPLSLNPEIGTEAELRQFLSALHERGMGLVLDIVPNHMGIGKALNPWWRDVLENGPGSRYADVFDIDWHPIKRELDNKVLLPILGDQYGIVLESQQMAVAYEEGNFVLRYGDQDLPLTPKSWIGILSHRLDSLDDQESIDVMELRSILTAIRNLPGPDERDPDKIAERYREREIIRKRLSALTDSSDAVRSFILENVRIFNGEHGRAESFDLLDGLLNQQVYRLASWKVASEEINYRRFFDINDLAAVRMEIPEVFRETHQLVFQLLGEGAVDGLRIDHVDGLYDPGRYLRQLQEWAPNEAGDERPLFLVVEKILGEDESLPDQWPVHGTTGYDFANLVNGLFVDPSHERAMTETYARFTGRRTPYDDLVYEAKKLMMRMSMSSEINVLGYQLNQLSERDRRSRDFTLNALTNAIREIIACFPVYRTYVSDRPGPVAERDRAFIHMAVAAAKRRNPALTGQVFDFVRTILLKQTDWRTERDREDQLRFVMKFQQMTSPVTAKGVEDTVFYRYNRFVSLNEVGGEPKRFGVPPEVFHKRMRERQARWPRSLSATSTHDTKRSEDVRARINVLSELPQRWRTAVARWSKANRKHRTLVDGQAAPDRNDEYLLYQTLVGSWSMDTAEQEHRRYVERIQRYMEKAIHEAKLHTSWVNPNQAYDDAVAHFIEACLDRSPANEFLAEFAPFAEEVLMYGLYNGLAQLSVKITAPGIPDFYQGTELWDFSLVDPDNRRPVDYAAHRDRLADVRRQCEAAGPDRRDLTRRWSDTLRDGRLKLYVAMTGLTYRRAHPDLFDLGEYIPLHTAGAKRAHVCAFARLHEGEALVVVVPRLVAGLLTDAKRPPYGADVWGDTTIVVPSWRPGSQYRDLLTGDVLEVETMDDHQVLPVADVLAHCPVALLERA